MTPTQTQTLGDLQANAAVPVTQFGQFLPLTGADMLGWLAPKVVPVLYPVMGSPPGAYRRSRWSTATSLPS